MSTRRVVIRTPGKEPDKSVSLTQVITWVSVIGAALLGLLNLINYKAHSETRELLRKEMAEKVEQTNARMDLKFDDVRKNTWPMFYTKNEIDERRKELDRRYDEQKAALLQIQQSIMELKLREAQQKGK